MKEQIKKILIDNSYKVDFLGTREESIEAIHGERIIDAVDIKIIVNLIEELFPVLPLKG